MAKRLAFDGPEPAADPAPQPGFAAALAAVEAGPGAGMDPELEKKLRRQSMDGTLPVSLNALRVSNHTHVCKGLGMGRGKGGGALYGKRAGEEAAPAVHGQHPASLPQCSAYKLPIVPDKCVGQR